MGPQRDDQYSSELSTVFLSNLLQDTYSDFTYCKDVEILRVVEQARVRKMGLLSMEKTWSTAFMQGGAIQAHKSLWHSKSTVSNLDTLATRFCYDRGNNRDMRKLELLSFQPVEAQPFDSYTGGQAAFTAVEPG